MSSACWLYLHKAASIEKWDFWSVLFLITMGVVFCSVVVTVFYLFRVTYNHEYGYLRSGKILKRRFKKVSEQAIDYRNRIDSYRASQQATYPPPTKTSIEIADEWSLNAIRDLVTTSYAEASENNRSINVAKSGFRHRANTALIVGLCALLVSIVPLCVMLFRTGLKSKVIDARIVNVKELAMEINPDNNGGGNGDQDGPEPAAQPTPAAEPEPVAEPAPPDPPAELGIELIKEGDVKRKNPDEPSVED